jgi:type II restriction enzyme
MTSNIKQAISKQLFFNITNTENEDDLFKFITYSFSDKITTWEYFVNWQKVFNNVSSIEQQLNILNYLIGKEDFDLEAKTLLGKYPEVVTCFPALIALRDASIDVLIDTSNFIYKNYNFKRRPLTGDQIEDLVVFLHNSGLANLFKNRKIKNLVDYVTGIEVGLDSNGRKNRGGTLMEDIVEVYIKEICSKLGLDYLPQANAKKIYNNWGINVQVDKSSRIIDFVIKRGAELFFIEVNFYGGGGSKLKSTATEYVEMFNYWSNQNITFIWITDGMGWQSTLKPLREYFDKSLYLLNLKLLKEGALEHILKNG